MADTDEATGEVIQTLVTVMAMNYGFYLNGITQCSTAITKFATLVEERVGAEAAEAFVGLGVATVISAGVATYAWHKVANEIASVVLQTQRLQGSTNFIQEWNAASVLAGQATNTFANSIEGLHERIQDLAMQPIQSLNQLFSGGNKPFAMLGLSALQLSGMGAEQQLNILADRLSQVHNQAVQLNIAKELGLEYMLPYLKDGSAGIARMHEELKALNLELTEGQTQSISAAVTAWRTLRLAMTGLENQIAAAIAPIIRFLAEVVTYLTEKISWLATTFPMLTRAVFGFGIAIAAITALVIVLVGVYIALTYVMGTLMAMNPFGQAIIVAIILVAIMMDLSNWLNTVTGKMRILAEIIYALVPGLFMLGKLINWATGSSSINTTIKQNYVGGGDPTMQAILANGKEQLNTQQQMVSALVKSAPPHMPYAF